MVKQCQKNRMTEAEVSEGTVRIIAKAFKTHLTETLYRNGEQGEKGNYSVGRM